MSNEKNSLLVTVLKKAVGIPTGNSSCCSPAPKEAPEPKKESSGSCCGAR
jgi:hypothetical protein